MAILILYLRGDPCKLYKINFLKTTGLICNSIDLIFKINIEIHLIWTHTNPASENIIYVWTENGCIIYDTVQYLGLSDLIYHM